VGYKQARSGKSQTQDIKEDLKNEITTGKMMHMTNGDSKNKLIFKKEQRKHGHI
jgi:hypothetical protein